jgi:hypothetical protein
LKLAVPITKPTKITTLNKPSKLVQLHAKEFSVDLRVQRQLNQGRAEEMAEDFQPEALGLLVASLRADGHTYIVDGQHRMVAARLAKYDGLLDTKLFTDLTLQEEAALFLALNKGRAIQAIDKFKARVTQGEPQACSINKVLRAYDLHVDWANNQSLNVISAIGTLEKVYSGCGVRDEGAHPDLVDKVIRTLHRAYDGANLDRSTYSRTMLEGLGVFVATFGKRINYDRLVSVLQGTVPRQIVAQTRTLRDAKVTRAGSLGQNAAEVIHRLYNARGWKDKLPQFHEVDGRTTKFEDDPLYVDPSQYVRA